MPRSAESSKEGVVCLNIDLARIIELDLVRATEAGALNTFQWIGKGDKNAADEAASDAKGLQHVEHTVLTVGEGGRPELHVICSELPGVTRFVETKPGEFTAYEGPFPSRIVVTAPEAGVLTYGWWWSRNETEPREQFRAEVRRTG